MLLHHLRHAYLLDDDLIPTVLFLIERIKQLILLHRRKCIEDLDAVDLDGRHHLKG